MILLLLTACADPARNLYEGMQQREGIANPHAQPTNTQLNYDRYEAERNKLREQEASETATPSGTSH